MGYENYGMVCHLFTLPFQRQIRDEALGMLVNHIRAAKQSTSVCLEQDETYLALRSLPKACTSALYPYTSILACADFRLRGSKSVGQKTPFFAVQVFRGSPFRPCTRTISTFASGCEYISVTSNRLMSSSLIDVPYTPHQN